jgi:SET domain-containing protein
MKLEISRSSGHRGVRARSPILAGEQVLLLIGQRQATRARHSLQIDTVTHLHPHAADADDPQSAWCLINHSCSPNCSVDLATMAIVALRAIEPDEELTFDYCTTESDLAEPFVCQCGAVNCYGEVRGFQHLPQARQRALAPHAAPHLVALVNDPR